MVPGRPWRQPAGSDRAGPVVAWPREAAVCRRGPFELATRVGLPFRSNGAHNSIVYRTRGCCPYGRAPSAHSASPPRCPSRWRPSPKCSPVATSADRHHRVGQDARLRSPHRGGTRRCLVRQATGAGARARPRACRSNPWRHLVVDGARGSCGPWPSTAVSATGPSARRFAAARRSSSVVRAASRTSWPAAIST